MNTTSTRILVPTDFTRASRAAVEYAASLGEQLHSDVDVLHVWRSVDLDDRPVLVTYDGVWASPFSLPPGAAPLRLEVLADFARTAEGHRMLDWLKELDERHVESHGRLAFGDPDNPTDAIIEVAKEAQYGLIVMTTHGRERLITHSVAEKVVRRAPCPVVTIRVAAE